MRANLDDMCAPDHQTTSDEPQGLGRRTLLAGAGLAALVGGAGPALARPAPASAATNLGETADGVETVEQALALAAKSQWGGYANGRVPSSALVAVPATVAGSGFLRDDAARQFLAMSLAFRSAVGTTLQITEGYRSYDRQVDYWNRYQAGTGNLAAYPGTSNHGWGISCDFGSGVQTYGTAAKKWMDANAPSYGWSPTGNGFSQREPWHFDYLPAWPGPTSPVQKGTGLLVLRCTQRLDVVGDIYTVLLGMRSLRHLLTQDQINALRVVGVPYHEVDRARFLDLLDAAAVPRSAIVVGADHWRR